MVAESTKTRNIEGFKRICGGASTFEKPIRIAPDDYQSFVETALCRLPAQDLPALFNTAVLSMAQAKKYMVQLSLLGCLMAALYMTASSYMIYNKKQVLEQREYQLTLKAGALIEKQQDLKEKQALLGQYRNMVQGYVPRANLLQALMTALPEGVLIRRIEITAPNIEIEGVAPDGAQVIESLTRQKEFVNPIFLHH